MTTPTTIEIRIQDVRGMRPILRRITAIWMSSKVRDQRSIGGGGSIGTGCDPRLSVECPYP
jgi:hypothetical protein